MKYLIHGLILLVGFGAIRGYYWYTETPAQASKNTQTLIQSMQDGSGWRIGKPEKDGDDYLVNDTFGGGIRVNADGKVVAWSEKDPENKVVLSSFSNGRDRFWIKQAYPEVREKIETRYLIKLESNAKEALVKGTKEKAAVVGPPAPAADEDK